MNYVIAFSGKAQTGKTTSKNLLIDLIYKEYPNLNPFSVSFAEPLKNIANEVFNWDGDKEIYFNMDKANSPIPDKGRQLLISIGGAFRAIRQSVWVDLAIEKIKKVSDANAIRYPNENDVFIIDDLRFENEAKVLNETFKGNLVLVRMVRETGIDIQDESEKSLDNYKDFNAEILNNGTKEQLTNQLRELMKAMEIV